MSRKDLKKMKISEETMISNKELQEQYISRVDVLDKVKDLFLIPAMECMTPKQVADYYEVPVDTIRTTYKMNREELVSDGAVTHSIGDIKSLIGCESTYQNITNCRGGIEIKIDENTKVFIPNAGIILYPKRAILRVGMLLRDSVIAKEVRTQLLNIVEVAQSEKPEIITQEIQKEEDLLLNIGKAFATGDATKLMIATQEYFNYQKRNIKKLENDKKLLTAEILTISDRQMFNAVMRKLAIRLRMPFKMLFGIFYKRLMYKYHINLKARGEKKKPYIQYIRPDEWGLVQQCIVAILEDNGINATEFLQRCQMTIKQHELTPDETMEKWLNETENSNNSENNSVDNIKEVN